VMLVDDVLQVLPEFRAHAESMMTDTCVIGFTTQGEFDDVSGGYPDVFVESYSGPCQFKAGNTAEAEVNSESQLLIEQDAVLKLPIATSLDVRKDHTFRLLSSATDPALVGVEGRVKGPFMSAYASARRFRVEVTS
jgi:hypothetical protein